MIDVPSGATPLTVYAVDAGSLRERRFAWCRVDAETGTVDDQGTLPSELVRRASEDLIRGAIALGIEAPLWWPVPEAEQQLGRARPNEGNRSWSAGAGATITPTAITQLAWIVRELAARTPSLRASVHASQVLTQPCPGDLLVWEAFVSRRGDRGHTGHANDAHDAAHELVRRIGQLRAGGTLQSDIEPDGTPVLNLAVAALLHAGINIPATALCEATLVVCADV